MVQLAVEQVALDFATTKTLEHTEGLTTAKWVQLNMSGHQTKISPWDWHTPISRWDAVQC